MSLDVDLYMEIDTGGKEKYSVNLFDANITHNLGAMAREADIYEHVWHPERLELKTAGELIPVLKRGIKDMEDDPERYKKHNPENNWGSYEGFVRFLKNYLEACERHPKALVSTCT